MSKVNWNELTPAIFAIGEAQNMDLSAAANMAQQNIQEGENVNAGAEALPEEFRPDWAALGGEAALKESNDSFNAWLRTMREEYKALTELWREKEYGAMVRKMGAAVDPGPLNPELREEWEKGDAD